MEDQQKRVLKSRRVTHSGAQIQKRVWRELTVTKTKRYQAFIIIIFTSNLCFCFYPHPPSHFPAREFLYCYDLSMAASKLGYKQSKLCRAGAAWLLFVLMLTVALHHRSLLCLPLFVLILLVFCC